MSEPFVVFSPDSARGPVRTAASDDAGGLSNPTVRMPSLMRLVMCSIALVVVLTAALDFARLYGVEDKNYGSQEALSLAGRQALLAQRMSGLAGQMCRSENKVNTAAMLKEALQSLQADRARLSGLTPFVAIAPLAGSPRAIGAATADVLTAELTSKPDSSFGCGDTSAVARLKLTADAYVKDMEEVVAALRSSAEGVARETQVAHAWQMTALALLVSLLALISGEWLARRMAHQNVRLKQLTGELDRLALVARRTDNGVIVADAHGRIEWANEGFTRISGYTLEEVKGRKPGSLLQFEGTDEGARQQLREALAARRPVQVDILNRSKHGRAYWLHLDIQPILDANGSCTGFSAVETDITSQVMERERLATLLRALPAGVIQHDAEGQVIHANPEACRILGLTQEQLLGQAAHPPQWHLVREDGAPLSQEEHPAVAAIRSGRQQRGGIVGVSLPGSGLRWLRVNAEPLLGPSGSLQGVVSSFVDITEASSQRRLLALTVDAAGLGTWDWNLASSNVQFNERWWQMLGYERDALPGTLATWRSLVHPQDLVSAQEELNRHLEEPSAPYRCEFRMQCADGHWNWVMAAGAVIERDADGAPQRMAGIHLDINQRKALEQRLSEAALTDSLTGLPNRAALKARLAQCEARSRRDSDYRYALLFMDFDRFKQINDSLGHEAGDDLLRQIAHRLRCALRSGDDLARLDLEQHTAVRLGGDEFVALLEPLQRPGDALAVAQRLLQTLAEPYQLAGQEVCSSVSIGIVTSERQNRGPEALLRDADTAMYEAKRRGRGRCVVFSEDMHKRVREALDLESELRRALRAPGELFVEYQPIVELDSGRIRGVEALARWLHPTRGAIPPGEFIPLAEECGLIWELGAQILSVACADTQRWRTHLGPLAPELVSVNLSRAQVRKGQLPDLVAMVLAETGLPPASLRLEITETLAMQDPEIVATLHELRRLGVSLALDDFGTGYSSLASLDQLPLDAVKVDRGFVQRMSESRYHSALIKATLQVAASLQLEVVAEGVETDDQATLLRQAGCPQAQGWLFGRPMTAAALVANLISSRSPA